MADVSEEVSMLIRARRSKVAAATGEQGPTEVDRRLPAEKTRKLERMSKIRQMEGVTDTIPPTVSMTDAAE